MLTGGNYINMLSEAVRALKWRSKLSEGLVFYFNCTVSTVNKRRSSSRTVFPHCCKEAERGLTPT